MLAFHFLLCVPGVLKRAHVAQILSGIHLGNCWVILLGSPLALDIDIYVGTLSLGGQNPVWNLILYLIRLIFAQSCTFNITKSAALVSFCASALKFTWCLLFKATGLSSCLSQLWLSITPGSMFKPTFLLDRFSAKSRNAWNQGYLYELFPASFNISQIQMPSELTVITKCFWNKSIKFLICINRYWWW